MNRANAITEITDIVQKYESYGSENSDFSEDEVCRSYILPVFEALGWDTSDPREFGGQKSQPQGRPDYTVYLNGSIAFFLEAKKLTRDLTEDDIKQALNYARTKNKRWAVLSNFRETIILVCDTKETSVFKHIYKKISYNEYVARFDDIALLSKESFQSGLIDKRAESDGRVKQTTRIDDELLDDILRWRDKIISSIKKNNSKEYSKADLEEIAQTLLNRIIFIRTVEDRKHEAKADETIRSILNQYEKAKDKEFRIDNRMNKLFIEYDKAYDSKLFTYDEKDITLRHECEKVHIDSQTYHKILKETYEKDNIYSYNFAEIDADVLGTMYEKYIGRIQSTRHDQGIYYTPTYIVDYIVQSTLGRVLGGLKNVRDADKVRVLDMACGSGSFLLRSFDTIDRYYRENEGRDYGQTQLDDKSGKGEALKVTKRAMVLRNNIYGVDLDPKAVEITQLNLLLRAAEARHRLPNLMDNVKYGNSLISQSLTPEMHPMEWNKEFEDIMNNGGFDVVIGNPPYVRQEEFLNIKPYLQQNYDVYESHADLYVYFFERALKTLKKDGYFGFIVSNKWLKAGYGQQLRVFLSNYYIEQFIDFGDLNVFEDASTYPCIIIIRNVKKKNRQVKVCNVKTLNFKDLNEYVNTHSYTSDQRELEDEAWNFYDIKTGAIVKKIKQVSTPLKEYVKDGIHYGIKSGLGKAFVIDEETKSMLIAKDPKSAEIIKPFLSGSEVRRYSINDKHKYIIFTRRGIVIDSYPAIKEYLEQFKPQLTPKKDRSQKVGRKPGDYKWYEIQDTVDYYEEFEKPKIIYGSMSVGPRFTLDYKGYYANNANFIIPLEDKKLLAILNSSLSWFLISHTCTQIRGGYQLMGKYFERIPIAKKVDKELDTLVTRMLELSDRLASMDKNTFERRKVEEELKKTDERIEVLVYNLYGLGSEDIQNIGGQAESKGGEELEIDEVDE